MPVLVRVAPLAAAALASLIALVRAWVAFRTAEDVNLVSGVWLALAADAREGIFYRPLLDAGYYGGTRYFPLLFVLIGGLMRLGLPPLAAGQFTAAIGGLVLVTGVWALLTRLGVGRALVTTGALLSVSPYFVLQNIFAIRADPVAAGLTCWGASFVASRFAGNPNRRWAIHAAACFTLAIAAKPTAAYALPAAIGALAAAGRRRDALRLGWMSAAGCVVLAGVMSAASDGRAWTSFSAGALGGGSITSVAGSLVSAEALRLAFSSRYLTAVMALVALAAAAAPRALLGLPGLLAMCSAAAAALTLATPGTILTNQAVEPYVAAAVYLTWTAGRHARARPAAYVILALLLLWAGARNGIDLHARLGAPVDSTAVDASRAILPHCSGRILAESPLLPVLSGERPILLDPFAFRVAAARRPDMVDDVTSRLRARAFACVVLEVDPTSPAGAGWYRNVHLGTRVIDALLEGYTLDRSVSGRLIYVPNTSGSIGPPGGSHVNP